MRVKVKVAVSSVQLSLMVCETGFKIHILFNHEPFNPLKAVVDGASLTNQMSLKSNLRLIQLKVAERQLML